MESIEKEKTIMTPSTVTLDMDTLEELSTLLVVHPSDQERYILTERIMIRSHTVKPFLTESNHWNKS